MPYGTVNADIIGTSVAGSNIGAGNASTMKNRIINGGCQIAQRGNVAIIANTAQFGGADRFQTYVAASTVTGGSMTGAAFSPSSTGYGQWAGSLSGTGVTAVQFLQRIESLNCIALNGNSVTISVGFYHDSGITVTGQIALLKATAVDNFTSTTTIATGSATTIPNATYTKLTFTTTLGSTDASNGLQVNMTFQFSSATISSKNFIVSEVQLEVGSFATGFDYRQIGTELVLCQRYYQQFLQMINMFQNNNSAVGNYAASSLSVTMRANPTAVYANITYSNASSLGTNRTNTSQFTTQLLTGSTASGYAVYDALLSAEL